MNHRWLGGTAAAALLLGGEITADGTTLTARIIDATGAVRAQTLVRVETVVADKGDHHD